MMEEFERYNEEYDETIRKFIETMYRKEYRHGWVITALVRMPDGKWLIKWGKIPGFAEELIEGQEK